MQIPSRRTQVLCSVLRCEAFVNVWNMHYKPELNLENDPKINLRKKFKYNHFCGLKASQANLDLHNTENISSQRPKACWEFWNQLEIIFVLLLSSCAHTCVQSTCQTGSAEYMAFLYAITRHLQQKSKKVVFSFSQFWLIYMAAKLPPIHTETVSLFDYVGDCWSIENRWLRAFVQRCW